MKFINDFRQFILRGNVVDLAIGFTVGAAFTSIVKSIVEDIIMPPLSLLLGSADFSNWFFVLRGGDPAGPYAALVDAKAAGAVTMNFGLFINNLITLLLVGLAMFFVIRAMNRMNARLETQFGRKKEPGEPSDTKCPFCLSTIPYRATRCPHCTSELKTQN